MIDDPRIPKPRALPTSLRPKPAEAEKKPEQDPFPPVSKEIVEFLEKHFPEKAYLPEDASTERVWYDLGIRRMVHFLRAVHREQNEKK